MTKRITQLLVRYISVALVAAATLVAGKDVGAEQVAPAAEAVAAGLVGFGGLLADLLIHRAETGGVTKPAGTKNPKKQA